MRACASFVLGWLLLVVAAPSTATAGASPSVAQVRTSVCDLIAKASDHYKIPPDYFARLIWQESRFRADARSPVGAEGIAQFMPRTAVERGLADSFSVPDALEQSAAYLSELRQTFGNLGLAAAAYNAGPGRLSRWLAGEAELPRETLDYVQIVTGHPIESWRGPQPPSLDNESGFSCLRFAEHVVPPSGDERDGTDERPKPWAVILLGNPQRDKALAEFAIVRSQHSKLLGGVKPSIVHRRIGGLHIARYIVQIERDSREAANELCSKLLRAGGNCFVLANR